jgi:hypothetical protein
MGCHCSPVARPWPAHAEFADCADHHAIKSERSRAAMRLHAEDKQVVSIVLSTRPVTFTFVAAWLEHSPDGQNRNGNVVGQTGLLIRTRITVVY